VAEKTPETPKAEKATTKKAKAEKTESKKDNGGLRKPQVRILKALNRTSKHLTRAEISEKAPADLAMLNSYIGSHDDATRAKNDKKNFPSLLTLGLIAKALPEDPEKNGHVSYKITAKGAKLASSL
jgi:hypothetical protein